MLAAAETFMQAGSRWARVLRLLVERDYAGAADALGNIGVRPHEAFARLRAAQQLVAQGRRTEADVQLQQSLAFWRSTGATRYVREGEALFAASA